MSATERTIEELATAVEAELDDKYELVYVDYRDELTPEQAACIVRGDFESLWDDPYLSEWESSQTHEASYDIVIGLAEEIVRRWEREDGFDWDDLLEEFRGSEEHFELTYVVRDRDESDWLSQLIRQTGDVLLRISALDEDHAFSFRAVEPAELLTAVGLPDTEDNRAIADATLLECSPEFSVLMGYWVVSASLTDLYELPRADDDDCDVEIVNPHLYLGNPFAGSGWLSEKPFEGTVRVKRSELRTDKDAFGYSVNDIYGGISTRGFEAKIRKADAA